MTEPRTSRQFVAIRALRDRLAAETWPLHPVSVEEVKIPVGYVDLYPDIGGELIAVELNPDETVTTWARVGPAGRDETFQVDVTIRSHIGGTGEDGDVVVFDRLEQLSEIVQLIAYDDATQRVVPFGFDGEVQMCRVSGHRLMVGPGVDGVVGVAVVSFEFQARI